MDRRLNSTSGPRALLENCRAWRESLKNQISRILVPRRWSPMLSRACAVIETDCYVLQTNWEGIVRYFRTHNWNRRWPVCSSFRASIFFDPCKYAHMYAGKGCVGKNLGNYWLTLAESFFIFTQHRTRKNRNTFKPRNTFNNSDWGEGVEAGYFFGVRDFTQTIFCGGLIFVKKILGGLQISRNIRHQVI